MKPNGRNHPDPGLSLEREEIIKQRIAENYYDRDDVLLEVAKRILECHDLDDFSTNNQTKPD